MTCNFIIHLPPSRRQIDVVQVIINKLTKLAHFIPIHTIYQVSTLAILYRDQIVRLHRVPIEIVSDREPIFTSSFQRSFQRELDTETKFNIEYHPQTDDQSKRMIQILEDLLRSYIMNIGGSWEEHLPLVEFAYNNNYQVNIGMTPFKALYHRQCRSPMCWLRGSKPLIVGPKLLQDSQRLVELKQHRLS